MRKLILLFILFLPIVSFSQLKVPELWGMRVHDDAKILSPGFVSSLEQQLKQYEDTTSNQIAVLIVPSLEGEVLEEYTLRVAEAWKLGTANNDNGALLFIAVNDRKVRIEVGEGLEGPLPDAICNQIIRNELAPAFRQGDYDGGVQSAVRSMIKAIGGEYQQEAPQTPRGRRGRSGGSFLGTIIIIFIIIIIQAIRNRGNRGGGRGRGRGWSSGSGWFGPTILGGGFGGGGGGWSGGGGFSGGGGGFSGGGSSGSW